MLSKANQAIIIFFENQIINLIKDLKYNHGEELSFENILCVFYNCIKDYSIKAIDIEKYIMLRAKACNLEINKNEIYDKDLQDFLLNFILELVYKLDLEDFKGFSLIKNDYLTDKDIIEICYYY